MRKLVRFLMSFFPAQLPVGLTAFHEWADDIIELAGRFADDDSMKFAISTMVLHLGHQQSSVSKRYFVRALRKVAANQVVSHVLEKIKNEQQARDLKQKAEATASTEPQVANEIQEKN